MHPEKTSENDDSVAGDAVAPAPETEAPLPRGDYPWRRAKKVAAMLSFSGKDYFGMQRNPGMRTIEEELMAAFRHSILSVVDFFYEKPQIFIEKYSIWVSKNEEF